MAAERPFETAIFIFALPAQMHLAFGASVVIMRRWDATEALRLVERHRVTTTHMVPANFQRILALPEDVRAAFDLSSLSVRLNGQPSANAASWVGVCAGIMAR